MTKLDGKIWWNEHGWRLGAHYDAASNVVKAHKLRGKLCSSSARWTTNVDPASTSRWRTALIKSNKMFDMLVIPVAGHTSGGPYGERKRNDFFVPT